MINFTISYSKNLYIYLNMRTREYHILLYGWSGPPFIIHQSYLFDIDPKCPLIFIGDEDRFKQVLLNLVTNAIKFTDKGWVLITCRLEKQLIVEVKDSGSGIENQQIETPRCAYYHH